MGYVDILKKGFQAFILNDKAMHELADDNSATGWGFLTLAIAGAAGAIGSLQIMAILPAAVVMIIAFIIGYSIFHFLAKFVFGGKATGSQYFRALSNVMVINWVAAIPLLGMFLQWAAGIWLIVVNIFILKHVHQLSWAKAIILGLILVILVVVVGVVAAVLTVGSIWGW